MNKFGSKIISAVLALCIVFSASCFVFAGSAAPSPQRSLAKVFENIASNKSSLIRLADGKPKVDGFTNEEVVDYFLEVALNSEFGSVRNHIIKYTEPVYYRVAGFPSSEDLDTLDRLGEALNSIEGFPGIYRVSYNRPAQATVYFMSEARFELTTGIDVPGGSWGYASISYYDSGLSKGCISGADIWISDEARPQNPDRNSVICEEFIQALGLLNDPSRGYYSIFDQNRNDCEWPSEIDWAVVKMLYSEELKPGLPKEWARKAAEEALKNIK